MNGQKKEKSMKPILFNTEMVKAILGWAQDGDAGGL